MHLKCCLDRQRSCLFVYLEACEWKHLRRRNSTYSVHLSEDKTKAGGLGGGGSARNWITTATLIISILQLTYERKWVSNVRSCFNCHIFDSFHHVRDMNATRYTKERCVNVHYTLPHVQCKFFIASTQEQCGNTIKHLFIYLFHWPQRNYIVFLLVWAYKYVNGIAYCWWNIACATRGTQFQMLGAIADYL